VKGRVEGAGGNREVPPTEIRGGAKATFEEERGSEPEAEVAA
jgi:hypothetical protein